MIDRRDRDRDPRRGEVTVELETAGLCHSDHHLMTGDFRSRGDVIHPDVAAGHLPVTTRRSPQSYELKAPSRSGHYDVSAGGAAFDEVIE
jgi:hypothetical protein